ncbi:MAG: hypothetical protein IKQ15_12155, partial [Kiritimatiellae bacterium]|nr:hypothetical protein [Kiritimatiellia bacterium]
MGRIYGEWRRERGRNRREKMGAGGRRVRSFWAVWSVFERFVEGGVLDKIYRMDRINEKARKGNARTVALTRLSIFEGKPHEFPKILLGGLHYTTVFMRGDREGETLGGGWAGRVRS